LPTASLITTVPADRAPAAPIEVQPEARRTPVTIQHHPRTPLVDQPVVPTRRSRNSRWAVPVGVVALATATVIGVTQVGDDTEPPVVANAASASDRSDYTRSQTLVQRSIDEALAANDQTANYTLAQTTIQRYIDEALADNGS